MWTDKLSTEDRRALVFIKAYEDCRRETQWGYSAFKVQNEDILDTPVFKQFRTVTDWLVEKGWAPTWQEHHWHGYVKFVFDLLKPSVPFPGQLKNAVLLKQYILAPSNKKEEINANDVEALYARILRPELQKHSAFLVNIGLKKVRICDQQQKNGHLDSQISSDL